MPNASELLAEARSNRRLSMNTLSDVSGVPVSTISRIESGRVEPTWSMMDRILTAAGFLFDPRLIESGTDEPFAGILRRLKEAYPHERARIIGRFPSVARLSQVARRTGCRRVQLETGLNDALTCLSGQGQDPVVSSLEAFARDVSETRSFFPVVYVDHPDRVDGFSEATRMSPQVMFVLPITPNVEAVRRDADGIAMVSREWGLLDSLASPGRQPDVTMNLLSDLVLEATQ